MLQEGINDIGTLSEQAPALAATGTHMISPDEMTGIQALERPASKPMPPGHVERVEFPDTRHGTQCVIATLDVVTGTILAPTVGDTRTEADFITHLRQTVAMAPEAPWIFVMDQLNAHTSESLVRWVADGSTSLTMPELWHRDRARRERPTRHSRIDGEPGRLLACSDPSNSSGLYAKTGLLVESDGDLVPSSDEASAETGEFSLSTASQRTDFGIY